MPCSSLGSTPQWHSTFQAREIPSHSLTLSSSPSPCLLFLSLILLLILKKHSSKKTKDQTLIYPIIANDTSSPDPDHHAVSGKHHKKTKKRKASDIDAMATIATTNYGDGETSSDLVEPEGAREDDISHKKKEKKKKVKSEDQTFVMEADEEEEEEKKEDPNAVSNFKIYEPLRLKLKKKRIESLFPIQAMTFDIIFDGSDLEEEESKVMEEWKKEGYEDVDSLAVKKLLNRHFFSAIRGSGLTCMTESIYHGRTCYFVNPKDSIALCIQLEDEGCWEKG